MRNKNNMKLIGLILLVLVFVVSVTNAEIDNNVTNETESVDMDTGIQNGTDEVEEFIDDIEPYEGSIGPGNSLYGLKIAFENLDDTFTFDDKKKIDKKVARARLRIAEAKSELKKNNPDGANRALELYAEIAENTDNAVTGVPEDDKGFFLAQKMIKKHQYVLENLNLLYPANKGLARALNNSIRLEEKFQEKTGKKIEKLRTKEGKIILKSIRKQKIEIKEEFEIKARVFDNKSRVKVEVKFVSNSTEKDIIAEEILKNLKLSRETVSDLIKIEVEEEEELKEKLEAEAEIRRGLTQVEAEFEFPLESADRTEIIDGTYDRLSSLTIEDILDVLRVKSVETGAAITSMNVREKIEEKKTNKDEIKQTKREEKIRDSSKNNGRQKTISLVTPDNSEEENETGETGNEDVTGNQD